MSIETIVGCGIAIIGVLCMWLVGMIVYLFHGLKSEIVALRGDISVLSQRHAELVHKDECHKAVERMHERIDDLDARTNDTGSRLTRLETSHEANHRGRAA